MAAATEAVAMAFTGISNVLLPSDNPLQIHAASLGIVEWFCWLRNPTWAGVERKRESVTRPGSLQVGMSRFRIYYVRVPGVHSRVPASWQQLQKHGNKLRAGRIQSSDLANRIQSSDLANTNEKIKRAQGKVKKSEGKLQSLLPS